MGFIPTSDKTKVNPDDQLWKNSICLDAILMRMTWNESDFSPNNQYVKDIVLIGNNAISIYSCRTRPAAIAYRCEYIHVTDASVWW